MFEYLQARDVKSLQTSFPVFLERGRTAMARGTFYHSREKMEEATAALHAEVLAADRGIYAASLLLDGHTDFTRQIGIHRLLTTRPNGQTFLSTGQEDQVLFRLFEDLRPQKVFDVFLTLQKTRKSGHRVKRFMLDYIIGSPKLEWWAVSYRRKLRAILTHCWGARLAPAIGQICAKSRPTYRELQILNKIHGHHGESAFADRAKLFESKRLDRKKVKQAIAFIMGNERATAGGPIGRYIAAKRDIAEGKDLPYRTLEGIRSVYHRGVPNSEVLKLTSEVLTAGDRRVLQRKAAAEGTQVDWDPSTASLVELLLYAYEQGLDERVKAIVLHKAADIRQKFERAGYAGDRAVVLDTSASMMGSEQQKLRPMAVAYALSLCLSEPEDDEIRLPQPTGHTELARAVVAQLETQPDFLFLISDGYENAPAGRVAEVLSQARNMGIQTGIYHLNPVPDDGGVRTFDGTRRSDIAWAVGIGKPEALPTVMLEGLLRTDVVAALELMIPKALEVLK